ncbi:hypothetical protein KC19_12G045600 [Ceratodon purpureus]|uniref:Uncharacterized protein n=1 Tax=Ceratodon purpureus TaxID=3225 RepID=A0A8T0G3S0_CERPU|nr:hypothetical protein KC19_12G045600 [Ceratodon purpureus]
MPSPLMEKSFTCGRSRSYTRNSWASPEARRCLLARTVLLQRHLYMYKSPSSATRTSHIHPFQTQGHATRLPRRVVCYRRLVAMTRIILLPPLLLKNSTTEGDTQLTLIIAALH